MRKWLQSKTFVTCLCVVAGLCIAGNFIRLPKRTPFLANARSTPQPHEAWQPLALMIPPSFAEREQSDDWRGLFPLETLRRDPFAPAALTVFGPGGTNRPSNMPVFTLQAVSIDAERSFAVINQTIVAEGEELHGYKIEKILPTQVRLSGALGSVIATLVRTDRDQKAASGSLPPADQRAVPVTPRPAGVSR